MSASMSDRMRRQGKCAQHLRRGGPPPQRRGQAGLHVGKASTDPMLWALKDSPSKRPGAIRSHVAAHHRTGDSGKLPVSKNHRGESGPRRGLEGFDVLTGAANNKLKILVSTNL